MQKSVALYTTPRNPLRLWYTIPARQIYPARPHQSPPIARCCLRWVHNHLAPIFATSHNVARPLYSG